jgi:2-hydroxychromene-2-carboxylate isomerase
VTPVEFYFDFASPCFLAAMQVDRVQRPTILRPFLLGAVYKQVGQSPLEHSLKREYVIKIDAPRMARRIGLKLNVPQGFPDHSLPPSRAFYWIDGQDPAKAIAFTKAAYRLYWLEGRSTTDERAAADAAASIGIDPYELRGAIHQSSVKERLIQENDRAIAKGVFGSPFFLVDGEPFWGTEWIEFLSTSG